MICYTLKCFEDVSYVLSWSDIPHNVQDQRQHNTINALRVSWSSLLWLPVIVQQNS